ncbi:putative DnaJ domain, Chaperone J-domain superfamily [Helianthus anomalus]
MATEEENRSSYIRLALKWHPDKKKGADGATLKFQVINEAYQDSTIVGTSRVRHENVQ